MDNLREKLITLVFDWKNRVEDKRIISEDFSIIKELATEYQGYRQAYIEFTEDILEAIDSELDILEDEQPELNFDEF